MIHAKIISSIEDLNEAKSFQYQNYYLTENRFLKSNLTSKTFWILSIVLGVHIYCIFWAFDINISLFISILFSVFLVGVYVITRIHLYWKYAMKNQMDTGCFIPFWLKSGNRLVGLYTKKRKSENLIGIGGIHTTTNPEICEMKRLWVDDTYRNRGSGKNLLKAIQDEALKLGYKKVVLSTSEIQHEAIRFYQKNNFNFIKKINVISVLPFNPFYVHHFDRFL